MAHLVPESLVVFHMAHLVPESLDVFCMAHLMPESPDVFHKAHPSIHLKMHVIVAKAGKWGLIRVITGVCFL